MKLSPTLLVGAAVGLVAGAAATAIVLSVGDAGPGMNRPAGAGGPPGAGRRGGYVPTVAMTRAEPAAIERRIDVIGEARSLRSVALVAEVAGLVDSVGFAPGQRVKEGDVLLQIVDDEQQVALARARADFPIARDNAARYRNLVEEDAASQLEAEQAQNEFIAAEAQLRAAEVAVDQRRIIAPFDGVAGLADLEPGDYLRAGDLITTLDDTTSILVEFAVPQESAGYVNIGQSVKAALTSDAAVSYDGEIVAIDSRVDPASRTLRVEAQLENPRGRLIPGAVFAVTTSAPGEPAIAVPGLAIQWDRNGAYVWRRNADGGAERTGIVILQRTDQMALVEGELEPGDVIVAEGADRVRRGVPLPALAEADSAPVGSVSAAKG